MKLVEKRKKKIQTENRENESGVIYSSKCRGISLNLVTTRLDGVLALKKKKKFVFAKCIPFISKTYRYQRHLFSGKLVT